MVSLQDQLLKAGVASKAQANKANAAKRKQKKQTTPPAGQQAALEAERQKKAQRDKALNQAREEEKARKAAQAEARQLIEQHQLALPEEAEIRYNFIDGTQIKYLWITPALQNQLARGRIMIIKQEKSYHLLPAEAAKKIEQRQPDWVLQPPPSQLTAEEASYAEHPIPDDLMW